jgi:hypothetical protein
VRTVRVAFKRNEFYDVTFGGLGRETQVLCVDFTRFSLSGAVESGRVWGVRDQRPMPDDVFSAVVRARSL